MSRPGRGARLIRVVQFQRRPIPGFHHSLEGYFAGVRRMLPEDIDARVRVAPCISSGIVRRIAIMADAAARRGDVVHVTGDIHFVTLVLPHRRSVLTVLDCGLGTSTNPVVRSLYRLLWMRWPTRRAGTVVAISAFTAGQLAQLAGLPLEAIRVIPVAVDDAYAPLPFPEERAAAPTVLCVGTAPNKNLPRIVQALSGTGVALHIVGKLSDSQRAALAASGLAWQSQTDVTDDEMRAAYAAADVVVFASTYEGFGMPIIEAQAVGRPVVTSDRAPMNEVAGGAACLVDPDDVASIRAGVLRVLGDEEYRRELVTAGYENRERFRPRVAAEAYAALYREIAAAAAEA